MAKKKFKIRAKIVFNGNFLIQAKSKEEAVEKIKQNCGAMLGNIQTLDDDVDWEFDTHGQFYLL